MSDIDEILDRNGNVRRLGSLQPPPGMVSSFQTFEETHDVWDDDQIKQVILDPNRTMSRRIFDSSWIQNQHSHGSCNGYAGAAALARARFLRGLRKVLLSGAYLYSKMNNGVDQGSVLEHGMRAMMKFGICPETLVPWNFIYPNRQPADADKVAAEVKGALCYPVATQQGLKTALAKKFPCIVAVHAGNRYQTVDKNGICGADNGPGNHAVCVDDLLWIGNDFAYDSPGSWGLTLGVDGRVICRWASFEQTFGRHTFYAVPTTFDAEA